MLANCMQRAHWRAAHHAILCLDAIDSHGFLVAGCRDHNVTIWTLDGALVGILGVCKMSI
jgi:hypothetical protein